jgi:hypothetical protein
MEGDMNHKKSKTELSQRTREEISRCASNVYIYNDIYDIDEKVIRIESTYLRITLENKKVKNTEIEEAIKEFYKIFGFNAPKIVSG